MVTLTVDDTPVLAVVVEAQLRTDVRKRRTWPAYVATLHHAGRVDQQQRLEAGEGEVIRLELLLQAPQKDLLHPHDRADREHRVGRGSAPLAPLPTDLFDRADGEIRPLWHTQTPT